jgi:hypothetical protein
MPTVAIPAMPLLKTTVYGSSLKTCAPQESTMCKISTTAYWTFEISAKILSQAYRLHLPLSMQCHKGFHISNLKIGHSPGCPPNNVPGRVAPQQDEFIVDSVLDFRVSHMESARRRGHTFVFLIHRDS